MPYGHEALPAGQKTTVCDNTELLEPYAMKVARTVLKGGKSVRPYLS
jgi:hypothetical protein